MRFHLTLLAYCAFMASTFFLAPVEFTWEMFFAVWACFWFGLMTILEAKEK